MELEFKNLANVKAEPSRFVSANLQVVSMNITKNDGDGDIGEDDDDDDVDISKKMNKLNTLAWKEKNVSFKKKAQNIQVLDLPILWIKSPVNVI